jgi:hypothetical protein
VVSDNEFGQFAFVLQILRRQSNGAEGEETTVLAYTCGPLNDNVVVDSATFSEGNLLTNDGIGSYANIMGQRSVRTDDGLGMNEIHLFTPVYDGRKDFRLSYQFVSDERLSS